MKNAKRILSVIICVILSLGIFAACGKNGNDIDESTTAAPDTTAIKQVNDFEEATFDISRALAMGMRFFDDPSYLDNASVMWNTLGWYCCRQNSTGGNEYLTRTQIDAIQHALRPGASAIAAPENWIKGGSLEVKGFTVAVVFHSFGSDEVVDQHAEREAVVLVGLVGLLFLFGLIVVVTAKQRPVTPAAPARASAACARIAPRAYVRRLKFAA